MGDNSAIEWTDATWNPLTGCTRVSAGCDNCYAATQAAGRLKNVPAYEGLAVVTPSGRAAFNGKIRLLPERLDQPLRWRRPRKIFVNSMSDLFHPDVPDEYIDRVFAVMALASHHAFQVLTKRPERAAEYCGSDEVTGRLLRLVVSLTDGVSGVTRSLTHKNDALPGFHLPNVHLGTSVEDQATADERIPHLLRTPAAVRFLSCEPLLGPIVLTRLRPEGVDWLDCLNGRVHDHPAVYEGGRVDQVIVGGESGRRARPMDVRWVRSIIEQCRDAGVAVFVKQLGRWIAGDIEDVWEAGFRGLDCWLMQDGRRWVPPIIGGNTHARPRGAIAFSLGKKGGDPSRWPEDLRVREEPEVPAS